MSAVFERGIRRLFGIKPKRKRILAPYGSIMRPEIISEPVQEFEIKPIVSTVVAKPIAKKKGVKKKSTKKKVVKKKPVKKKPSKKKVVKG